MMTWSEAFTRHLDKLGLSQQDALFSLRRSRIKATVSQICYWRRGTCPRAATRRKIERWSGGSVPADLPRAAASETYLGAVGVAHALEPTG